MNNFKNNQTCINTFKLETIALNVMWTTMMKDPQSFRDTFGISPNPDHKGQFIIDKGYSKNFELFLDASKQFIVENA